MILLCCVGLEHDGLCTQVHLVGWCEPRWLARKKPPYWGAKSGVRGATYLCKWWTRWVLTLSFSKSSTERRKCLLTFSIKRKRGKTYSENRTPISFFRPSAFDQQGYRWIAQSPTKVGTRISATEDLIFCIDMYISKDAKWSNRSGLKIRKSFGQRGLRICSKSVNLGHSGFRNPKSQLFSTKLRRLTESYVSRLSL
jgi:hypothetical protein